ncbi:hypothetical protein EI555_013021, partial [Monodon monoceros]
CQHPRRPAACKLQAQESSQVVLPLEKQRAVRLQTACEAVWPLGHPTRLEVPRRMLKAELCLICEVRRFEPESQAPRSQALLSGHLLGVPSTPSSPCSPATRTSCTGCAWLQHTREQDFEMNGRALCILTKDDFPLRSLGSADVLYELLQYIKTQRQAVACGPFFGRAFRQRVPTQPFPCCLEGDRGLLQQPPALGLASSLSHVDAPGLASWPLSGQESLSLSHCVELGCRAEGVSSFPTMPQAPIDGRITDCQLLWDYKYQLLSGTWYEPYIKRHVPCAPYHNLNIIKKEPRQKLLFRFLKTPRKINQEKGNSRELLESQEQDRVDFKEEMLEVSL